MIIAVDFDHTIADTAHPVPGRRMGPPLTGAKDSLEQIRALNHKVLVHSCNRPSVIREWMQYYTLPFSSIWGEGALDHGKPVADYYIDDSAIRFETWNQVMRFLDDKPSFRMGR